MITLPNRNHRDDQINDQINDNGLRVLRIVSGNPGITVPWIIKKLGEESVAVSADVVRNSLRRDLAKYVEHRGSNKTGGYYRIGQGEK